MLFFKDCIYSLIGKVQQPRLGQTEARSQEFHPVSCMGCRTWKVFSHHLLLFQAHSQQENGLAGEELEVLLWPSYGL